MTSIKIAGRLIGSGHAAFVIAEVAQAHDGSLGMAHAFIDAIADAGADAVKFQTHIASAESTLDEPFRTAFSRQDPSRFHYWKRMEFTEEQWRGLAQHASRRGLIFLSSAFSKAAVQLLDEIGTPAWKLGSGEFAAQELWEVMAATRKSVIISTGMATPKEIDEAVTYFRKENVPIALLQCTSAYPCPLEKVGLNVITELRDKYGCPVGLSEHSGTVFPGLAALARGADILEVHVTFHRGMFGPDTSAAVTFDELKLLCEMRDALCVMDSHQVDKGKLAEQLRPLREMFGRSLAPLTAFPAGAVLAPEMFTAKKPAGGIPPEALTEIAGRRLAREITPDRILRWDDLAEDEK